MLKKQGAATENYTSIISIHICLDIITLCIQKWQSGVKGGPGPLCKFEALSGY